VQCYFSFDSSPSSFWVKLFFPEREFLIFDSEMIDKSAKLFENETTGKASDRRY
jgi:hypothetical protein